MRFRESVEVADACKHLHASRSSIYRLIKAGEIEGYRLGKGPTSKYLIYADSIEAYKQRQAVRPAYDRERIKKLLAA